MATGAAVVAEVAARPAEPVGRPKPAGRPVATAATAARKKRKPLCPLWQRRPRPLLPMHLLPPKAAMVASASGNRVIVGAVPRRKARPRKAHSHPGGEYPHPTASNGRPCIVMDGHCFYPNKLVEAYRIRPLPRGMYKTSRHTVRTQRVASTIGNTTEHAELIYIKNARKSTKN